MDVLDRSQTAKPTIDLFMGVGRDAFGDCICKKARVIILLGRITRRRSTVPSESKDVRWIDYEDYGRSRLALDGLRMHIGKICASMLAASMAGVAWSRIRPVRLYSTRFDTAA